MEYQNLVYQALAPEELTGVINQANMEHRILPGGVLNASVEMLQLEQATLQRGSYEMGVQVSGSWPEGCVCLGLVLESPWTVAVNGFLCPARSVQLYSEGKELNYCAVPGSTWFAYCAHRDYVQQMILDLCGSPLPIPDDGVISFKPDPLLAARLTYLISRLFDSAKSLIEARMREGSDVGLEALGKQLLYEIASCVFDADKTSSPSLEIRHAQKRSLLMNRAEDYLMANLSESFNLHQFASAVDVSARMLEYQFRKIYGMTPNQWFRCMKMNAVRRELLSRSHGSVTISQVALAWGFSHFGRFSVEYRQLFGEMPKQTAKFNK